MNAMPIELFPTSVIARRANVANATAARRLVEAGITPHGFVSFPQRSPIPLYPAANVDELVALITSEPQVLLGK